MIDRERFEWFVARTMLTAVRRWISSRTMMMMIIIIIMIGNEYLFDCVSIVYTFTLYIYIKDNE
jgi:hypothetical protein